ncbi:hypothetical protein RhiirA4_474350 [Rhizophagus irregularis]|uniref:Uncharacterized protein n=1 Tax=Rhizophagus irregularis TaxID=588596 RepID=A0A2I1H8B2_9GLOM|nr:hypothetical protein RhiirA4_474350 [Rhizophagus irregularis]
MKGQYNLSTGVCYWRREKSVRRIRWLIEIEFEDIEAMFNPVIGKIIRLIRGQLEKRNKKCSTLMMLTGWSLVWTSRRKGRELCLKKDIRQTNFLIYLDAYRIYENLKHLIIGTDIAREFQNGLSIIFNALTKRGEQVPVNKKVIKACSIIRSTYIEKDFEGCQTFWELEL